MYMNKKIITAGLSVVMFLGMVTAQVSLQSTSGDIDPNGQVSSCVNLVNNLRYKMKDVTTDGEVTALQDFLIANNFMTGESTGYFGAGTLKAVKLFQMKKGLNPTGYVGPLTRDTIKKMSCDTMFVSDTLPVSTAGDIVKGTSICKVSTDMPKYCPDGTPIPRDIRTCQFLEWKCGDLSTSVASPVNKKAPVAQGCNATDLQGNCNAYDPLPTVIIRGTSTGVITLPPKYKIDPINCTMEMKYCPNGAPMSRDGMCGWHPELCQGVADRSVEVSGGVSSPKATDGTVVNPIYTMPTKTSDAVEINPQNTYSLKYLKLPVATTTITPVVKTICTMQVRLCPSGDVMYRDEMCGWHEEKCRGTSTTGMQCSKDPFSGELFCGAPGTAPANY